MEVLHVVEVLLFVVVFLSILYAILCSLRAPLPGPGFRQYLPNGIVYPMLQDPHQFSRVIEKLGHVYGDVFSIWMGHSASHVVFTAVPEDVIQILSDAEDFDRPPAVKALFNTLAPGGVFCMSGTKHRNLRKRLRDGFNHSMLNGFHEDTTQAIEELCEGLSRATRDLIYGFSEVVDLPELIAVTTFRIITNVAFGTSMNRDRRVEFHSAVREVANEMTEDIVGYPIRQLLTPLGVRNRFLKVCTKIRGICSDFIRERLKETQAERDLRTADLLDAILSAEDHSISELTSVTTEFTLGGTYSVAQSVAWAVYEICRNKRVRLAIEREISAKTSHLQIHEPIPFDDLTEFTYLVNVWREVCRLHPVGPFLTRKTTRNVTLKGSGIYLPKGVEVFANYKRCHMSPMLWKDPEIFKPERWGSESPTKGMRIPPGAFLTFGLGPHNCPGRFLADYQGPLILAELYRRFEFKLACAPEEICSSTTFVESPTYRNPKTRVNMGLPVQIQTRSNL